MPTYVYHCSLCRTEFEAYQRITEPALDSCPEGHAGSVRRVIQPVGIAFKGEGFHINDYSPKAASSSSGPKSSTPKSDGPAAEPTSTPAEPAAPAAAPDAKTSEP